MDLFTLINMDDIESMRPKKFEMIREGVEITGRDDEYTHYFFLDPQFIDTRIMESSSTDMAKQNFTVKPVISAGEKDKMKIRVSVMQHAWDAIKNAGNSLTLILTPKRF